MTLHRGPMISFALIVLLSAILHVPPAIADEAYEFTESTESIVGEGEEWTFHLPEIPRDRTYWIYFDIEVQNDGLVDVRLVDSVNETMQQEGRISAKTVVWEPDRRYVASSIVVTPSEAPATGHTVEFSWQVHITNYDGGWDEEEGPTVWEEHGPLIMGTAAVAIVVALLASTLKVPSRGVDPEAQKDMAVLRFHQQKMR